MVESAFQSTFPRGERHMVVNVTSTTFYFNPRSRVGNDWKGTDQFDQNTGISIHVPAWGTTLDGWQKSCTDVKFQSTFPRGERQQIFTNILCFFMQ